MDSIRTCAAGSRRLLLRGVLLGCFFVTSLRTAAVATSTIPSILTGMVIIERRLDKDRSGPVVHAQAYQSPAGDLEYRRPKSLGQFVRHQRRQSGVTPPLLPARLFAGIEAPLLAGLFSAAEKIFGEHPPCIIGGDAAPIARDLMAAGPGYVIAPSETDQSAFVEAARKFPGIHVRINLPAAMLLNPDRSALESAAADAVRLARSRENTSLGCGVVPYEARPEDVHALAQMIRNPREIL